MSQGCRQCWVKEERGEESPMFPNNKWGTEHDSIKELWIRLVIHVIKHATYADQRSNSQRNIKKFPKDNFWLQDDYYSGKKYELALEGKVSRGAYLQLDHKSIISGIDRLVFDGGEPPL